MKLPLTSYGKSLTSFTSYLLPLLPLTSYLFYLLPLLPLTSYLFYLFYLLPLFNITSFTSYLTYLLPYLFFFTLQYLGKHTLGSTSLLCAPIDVVTLQLQNL